MCRRQAQRSSLHISKSDCWDIRVTKDSDKEVRPFSEILEMWRKASAELKAKETLCR